MTTTHHTIFDDALALGRIIQSNSHIDYTARIYTERDVDDPPEPEDYRFGQPVVIPTQVGDSAHVVVAVIYDTRLVDPDAGSTTPRLASGEVDETFRPSLVDERTTLVGIALLGTAECDATFSDAAPEDGSRSDESRLKDIDHSIPPRTLRHQATVRKCPEATFREFHLVDGELQLAYYPRLIEVAGTFGVELAESIIQQLRETTEGYDRLLDVIERKATLQAGQDRGVIR
jgi:hypothetical protein